MSTFTPPCCHRREFLSQMILIGAGGMLPIWAVPTVHAARDLKPKEVMLDQLTVAHFTPHVGGKFMLNMEHGKQIDVELVQAVTLPMDGARPAHLALRESFSLVFMAPADSGLSQDIYHVGHEAMGEFDIFLVPIGRDKSGLKCQAIFN